MDIYDFYLSFNKQTLYGLKLNEWTWNPIKLVYSFIICFNSVCLMLYSDDIMTFLKYAVLMTILAERREREIVLWRDQEIKAEFSNVSDDQEINWNLLSYPGD